MKRIAIICVLIGTMFLTGCFGRRRMSPEQMAHLVDEMAASAHSLVSASLRERRPFDEQTEEYVYELLQHHAGAKVAETFHVIDAPSDRLEPGEHYFLILNRTDNALYPFPLYSSRNAVLLVSLTPEEIALFRDQPVRAEEFSVPAYLDEQIKTSQLLLLRPQNLVELSTSKDLAEVVEQADRVWEARFTAEKSVNPYVSEYKVESVRVLKGGGEFMNVQLLPAGLDPEKSYLVPERAFSETSESYMPFARYFPVIEAESADGEATRSLLPGA